MNDYFSENISKLRFRGVQEQVLVFKKSVH